MTPSTRFSTLIRREWMQHKRGWLITLLLPPLLFLALTPLGQVQGLPVDRPLPIAAVLMLVTTAVVFGISYIVALFQLPGLARRDQQDRSIEFWLSLPAGHGESIAATLLTHALLVPLAAALVGFAFGGLVAPALLAKQGGLSALTGVPWFGVLGLALPALLRGLFGILLMSLWLAPLILIVMVASAWLKRWGVPAIAIAVGVGGAILAQVYENRIVFELLQAQLRGAGHAILADPLRLKDMLNHIEESGEAFHAGAWALQDALTALGQLASPHLVLGLAVAAGCFALLVLKRSRSG